MPRMQGSVLGPKLFVFFTNDLPSVTHIETQSKKRTGLYYFQAPWSLKFMYLQLPRRLTQDLNSEKRLYKFAKETLKI